MTADENPSPTAAPHPEEMKGTVHLCIGGSVSLEATWRTTPAGLVCAGVLVSAILLSLVPLVRAARQLRLDPW